MFDNIASDYDRLNHILSLNIDKGWRKKAVMELSLPSNTFIRWCYKLYFLKLLPAIGGIVSGKRSAYEYLPASVGCILDIKNNFP